jgi:hypothetical protein
MIKCINLMYRNIDNVLKEDDKLMLENIICTHQVRQSNKNNSSQIDLLIV